MNYLIAFLLPPLAVLLTGRPLSALLNIVLTLMFYFPGAIHAVLLVHGKEAERRNKEVIEAISHSSPEARAAFLAKEADKKKRDRIAYAAYALACLLMFVVLVRTNSDYQRYQQVASKAKAKAEASKGKSQ